MSGLIKQCRACGSQKLKQFFELGHQPLANSLLANSHAKEKKYPLALLHCADCSLIQLGYTVTAKTLFSKYVWVTGTSGGAKKFSEVFCKELIKRAPKINDSYVLEIASNDGTFLKPFINRGYEVLGIDPAQNITQIARDAGVPTETAFWSAEEAVRLVLEKGKAKIIFARNVLPHVENTIDFAEGLAVALDDDGILAIEVHYSNIILEELHYDSIYHEHLCYFTLKSLENLLNSKGLFAFDISASPISGGSVIVYARKTKGASSTALKKYRSLENKKRINSLAIWKKFASRSFQHKAELTKIIDEVSGNGNYLTAFGASARSSTLLNFCGIGNDKISIIADNNPLKHGKYSAGSHILITSPKDMMDKKPTHILILAWNFEKEIKDELKNSLGFKGTYIIPLPNKPRIIKRY